jgi:Cof subfamily protein (haloacid dehalogenase superfamily)
VTIDSTPPFDLLATDPRPDIRLIAADMDGTLLDQDDRLHEHLWPLIDELSRRGILFCPASGRQYHNLLERFGDVADRVAFIAENGAYVVRDGREITSDCLAADAVEQLVGTARQIAASGVDLGVVVCGKKSAYIERPDTRFLAEVTRYFSRVQVVPDLLDTPGDDMLKVAFYDFGSAEITTAPALAPYRSSLQVVVSGPHWVDVVNSTANKGAAVRHLQDSLGIEKSQTMVFGDFLNDLQMMETADYSFAMDNAHPALREAARFIAPANTENGVVRTISAVLGLNWSN